jgi:hypothetical protein
MAPATRPVVQAPSHEAPSVEELDLERPVARLDLADGADLVQEQNRTRHDAATDTQLDAQRDNVQEQTEAHVAGVERDVDVPGQSLAELDL